MKNKIYSINGSQLKAEDVAFDALFDLLPINFCWLDKNGYILGCNQKLMDFTKTKTFNDIAGKHATSLSSEAAWTNSKKVMEAGVPQVFEEVHLNKNFESTYFLSIKSPLICENKVIGVVILGIDITDRKLMELNLIQLKEAAELTDKAKTEFLTNMRHDLRTPLSGIVTLSEFLEINETESTKKTYLNDIRKCAESMLSHLNEILAQIKVESGEFAITEKEFDLNTILQDIYRMMLPMAKSKNIDFTLTLDQIPSNFIGDVARTERILINIISNSIKFTDKGYVKVIANWFPSSNQKGILQFIIADTGIGIPEDKKAIVFEKFSRLNPSYEGVYTGSGLGLNIVKQFIEELKGDYELTSVIGEGTLFKVRLPFKIPLLQIRYAESLSTTDMAFTIERLGTTDTPIRGDDLSTTNVQLPHRNFSTTGDLKTPKILLVEDNQIISRISKDLLEGLNCKVDIAETGTKALELANQYHYDLVLMDIGLPDISGYDVTAKIRSNKNNVISTVPIVAITAHTEDEERQKCLDVGMNRMITKPLTYEIAKSIISQL